MILLHTTKLYPILFTEGRQYRNPEGFWGDAGAGILMFARSTSKFLVLKRSPGVKESGTWGLAGGALNVDEDGQLTESPEDGARREAREELGISNDMNLVPAHVFTSPRGTFKYYNFIGIVEDEFDSGLGDGENTALKWLTLEELKKLDNKHFGLRSLIANSSDLLDNLVSSGT
jgi:8-oxo-dGTP pyrophosphatase MutT (NUDIX family)